MKIKCKIKGVHSNITEEKLYDVIEVFNESNAVKIIDDNGNNYIFPSTMFEHISYLKDYLSEIRNEKLNDILNS